MELHAYFDSNEPLNFLLTKKKRLETFGVNDYFLSNGVNHYVYAFYQKNKNYC
jgi:hypothetical protein